MQRGNMWKKLRELLKPDNTRVLNAYLEDAIMSSDCRQIVRLIHKGADPLTSDLSGNTVLHLGVLLGKDFIKDVLDKVDVSDRQGFLTMRGSNSGLALHRAIQMRDNGMAQMLLEYAPDPQALLMLRGFIGKTTLHEAVSTKNIESLQLLFSKSTDLQSLLAQEDVNGLTALHMSASRRCPLDVANLLLSYGAEMSNTLRSDLAERFKESGREFPELMEREIINDDASKSQVFRSASVMPEERKKMEYQAAWVPSNIKVACASVLAKAGENAAGQRAVDALTHVLPYLPSSTKTELLHAAKHTESFENRQSIKKNLEEVKNSPIAQVKISEHGKKELIKEGWQEFAKAQSLEKNGGAAPAV